MSVLLFSSTSGKSLAAGANVVTCTAPTASLLGDVALAASANVVTCSAPGVTTITDAVLNAGSNTVTCSAPVATSKVDVSLAAGANVVTCDAPTASLVSNTFVAKVTLANVDHTNDIILDTIDISPGIGQSSCSFQIKGTSFIPLTGMDVKVGLGASVAPANLIFGGSMQTIELTYDEVLSLPVWNVTCTDHLRMLNKSYPLGHYVNTPAGAILSDLVARYAAADGFVASPQAGLPSISMDFDGGAQFFDCVLAIANRVGGYGRCTYGKVVQCFTTNPDTVVPEPLDHTSVWALLTPTIKSDKDVGQIRTRVPVTGASASVDVGPNNEVAAGSTSIPLNTQGIFSTGKVKSGTQIIDYVGTSSDVNVGTKSAGIPQHPSAIGSAQQAHTAQTAPKATAGNVDAGVYAYVVTDVNDKDEESEPSAAQVGSISSVPIPSAPGASTSGPGKVLGSVQYAVTSITPTGETLPSGRVAFSVAPVSAAAAPSNAAVSGPGKVAGAVTYAVTNLSGNGESLIGAGVSFTVPAVPGGGQPGGGTLAGPGNVVGNVVYGITNLTANGETQIGFFTSAMSVPTIVASGTIANVSFGAGGLTGFYQWRFTVSTVNGETPLSTSNLAAATLTSNAPTFSVFAPADPLTRITKINFYRTKASGSVFYLIGSVGLGPGANLVFTDNTPDSSLSVQAPVVDTAQGGSLNVTIPVSSDARVIGRNLYRTRNGGSTFFFVASLKNNSVTAYIDAIADSSLTTGAPTTSTAEGAQLQINIPISSDNRVTGRGVYRTKNGGSIFFQVGVVRDNVSNIFIDNTADSSLTTTAPSVSTSDGASVLLSLSLPSDDRVSGLNIYRTKNGDTALFLVGSVRGNTTTSYRDNTDDSSLTTAAPTTSTADNGKMYLSGIASGPSDTKKRKIYRGSAGKGTSDLAQVGTLQNNTDTTFIDNTSDDSRGDAVPLASKYRTAKGSTTLLLVSPTYTQFPGWFKVGQQVVYATGLSGGSLTGIPSAGVGALLSDVTEGTPVIGMPFLYGVSGITYALSQNATINLWVQRDATAAQAALAAREGGDGIHVFPISDSSCVSVAMCNARGDAELALYKDELAGITYPTNDIKTLPGRAVTINQGRVSETLIIQSCHITKVGTTVLPDGTIGPPFYDNVQATTAKYTIQDFMRQLGALLH